MTDGTTEVVVAPIEEVEATETPEEETAETNPEA